MSSRDHEVIRGRSSVRVGPGRVGPCDILEYAEALILQHGWRQEKDPGPSDDQHGYTLHDAIGRAGSVLLSDDPAKKGASGGKGDVRYEPTEPTLRALATEIVAKHIAAKVGSTMDDKAFNDQATEQDVRDVLAAAREEACSGGN